MIRLFADRADVDAAIEYGRAVVEHAVAQGEMMFRGAAVAALTEALLRSASPSDIEEAQRCGDQLAAVETDPGFVFNELYLLRIRALLARAHGDATAYHDYADRYRAMAEKLGFEGHMAIADDMR